MRVRCYIRKERGRSTDVGLEKDGATCVLGLGFGIVGGGARCACGVRRGAWRVVFVENTASIVPRAHHLEILHQCSRPRPSLASGAAEDNRRKGLFA